MEVEIKEASALVSSTEDLPVQWGFCALVTDRIARKFVWVFQLLFIAVALLGIDSPFLSVHFERQNQTFDIARHVFQDGWQAVLFPKASFSLPTHPTQPFTIARLEVPFYGIFAWPLAVVTGHERAAVRLVAVFFAVLSINLIFRILRHWLDPGPALVGTFVWTTAPLVLHFGGVPMPDILCTTGILASFYFALRGSLGFSSAAFLFSILAKESVIGFGLPILVALLIAKGCRSLKQASILTLVWGMAPLLGLAAWISLDALVPHIGWNLYGPGLKERGRIQELVSPVFYLKSFACLFPFGLGLLGALGILAGIASPIRRINSWLWWSIIISCTFYIVFVLRKITEPQYFLPLLIWLVIAASFGFARLLQRIRPSVSSTSLIWAAVCVHILLVCFMVLDLKSSRVIDFASIEEAGQLIPLNARVIVAYRHYGAAPAVWLDRNVIAISGREEHPADTVQALQTVGFTHLMILDLESRYSAPETTFKVMIRQSFDALLNRRIRRGEQLTQFTGVDSPVRHFCDQHYSKLLERPHVILYSLLAAR